MPKSPGEPRGRSRPEPSAFERAVQFLRVRDRSEKEVRLKLRQKRVPADEIDATIERLRHLGYLDETRMARSRAQWLVAQGKLGSRGVAARLAAAGVKRDVAREAVDHALEGSDEGTVVRALLLKRYPRALEGHERERARALRFFLGRGFSPSVVGRVLRAEVEDLDEGDEP